MGLSTPCSLEIEEYRQTERQDDGHAEVCELGNYLLHRGSCLVAPTLIRLAGCRYGRTSARPQDWSPGESLSRYSVRESLLYMDTWLTRDAQATGQCMFLSLSWRACAACSSDIEWPGGVSFLCQHEIVVDIMGGKGCYKRC